MVPSTDFFLFLSDLWPAESEVSLGLDCRRPWEVSDASLIPAIGEVEGGLDRPMDPPRTTRQG